jgi:hypothetical protein
MNNTNNQDERIAKMTFTPVYPLAPQSVLLENKFLVDAAQMSLTLRNFMNSALQRIIFLNVQKSETFITILI